MSDTSVDKKNGPDTPDYATELNNIKQGVVIMNPSSATAKSLLQAADELDNAAWVDFSEIRFFLEPAATPPTGLSLFVPLTAEEIEMMREIDSAGGDSRNYQEQFYSPFKQEVAYGVRDHIYSSNLRHYITSPAWTVNEDPESGVITAKYNYNEPGKITPDKIWDVPKIVQSLFDRLAYQDLADLADSYFSIWFLSTSDLWAVKQAFFTRIKLHFYEGYEWYKLDLLYDNFATSLSWYPDMVGEIWATLKEKLINEFGAGSEDIGALQDAFTFQPSIPPSEFPFMTFPANDINLGLRLVYRQEWRPLGIQRGEVVRTIPLGPKQSEKVSTKIVRRSKVTRTSESLKSTEATTETSDTAKDSSEIVDEASSAMNWNVNLEVEGSYNTGMYHVGGKLSSGLAGESAESSKETSAHLSETMRKVANKVRTETKVVVSTEFEETFEATSASEIQNPNDEIAITYVFSKLQRQYEILTQLAEVQDVIMVAEDLPRPGDIDFDWVKKHDWIIAKVLLDDSFRDALSSISQEAGQPDMKKIADDLHTTQTETIKHLGTFAATAQVTATNIDFAVESQKGYLSTAKEQLERLRQNYLLDAKRYRLYEHIRENILHYQRAIWQHEDPQQRQLRYRKRGMTVPLQWWFQPDIGEPMSIGEFENDSESGIKGDFVANMLGRMLPITDLINPAGPIAFYGNYAVYYMRPEYAKDSDIMPLLEIFKSPYVYNGELMDPVQKNFEEQCDSDTVSEKTIGQCQEEMIAYLPELQQKYQQAKAETDSGRDPQAIDKFLKDYQTFKDFYDKYLLWKVAQCWEDMMDYVPDLRLKYLKAQKALPDDKKETSAFDLLKDKTFKDFYPEYLFRKEQTRRFLVDTNCLMIDLLPGEGSALEPFKQMHRAIDVLKAEQERMKMSLDNERRKKLIKAHKYGDPDIEKVVVVSDKDTKIVAGLETGED